MRNMKKFFVISVVASMLLLIAVVAEAAGANLFHLSPTNLGAVTVEGEGLGEMSALKENVDLANAEKIAPPVKTLSSDDVRLGDPTAKDSPVTLSSQSQNVSLSRTDLGDITVEGQGAGKVEAIKEETDPLDVKRDYRKAEDVLMGSVSVGGTIEQNTMHLYGPYWFDSEEVVTFSVSWAPATSPLRFGLTSQQSNIFYGCESAGGSGACEFTVNQSGWYYPTIWNAGQKTATYNGYVSW